MVPMRRLIEQAVAVVAPGAPTGASSCSSMARRSPTARPASTTPTGRSAPATYIMNRGQGGSGALTWHAIGFDRDPWRSGEADAEATPRRIRTDDDIVTKTLADAPATPSSPPTGRCIPIRPAATSSS